MLTCQDELELEYEDEMWYQILNRLAARWVQEGKPKERIHELEHKLYMFRSQKGLEFADNIRKTYGIR